MFLFKSFAIRLADNLKQLESVLRNSFMDGSKEKLQNIATRSKISPDKRSFLASSACSASNVAFILIYASSLSIDNLEICCGSAVG